MAGQESPAATAATAATLLLLASLTHPISAQFSGLTALDTDLIYEGIFLRENIIVGVIQNWINFVTSTIGWAVFLPFYEGPSSRKRVRRTAMRTGEGEEPWDPTEAISHASRVLRSVADTLEIAFP